jgi:hypothetical protein
MLTLKKKHLLVCGLIAGLFVAAGYHSRLTYSASLTNASVTLVNPRLSFRASLNGSNSVGSSDIFINTSSGHPSLSTAQLQEGDTVRIGEAGSLAAYTVATTNPTSEFTTTTGLASGDADNNDDVISSQSGTVTIRFTTANAVANGRFRVLIPSLTSNTDAADGIPDSGLFDFGSSTPTVTCPADVGATYDFVAGTASASAITISGADYHSFECAYSGTGAVGTAFNGSSQGYIQVSSLINPAPESGHTTGTADTQNIVIQHLDSSIATQDTVTVSVGEIEAVKVTATVPASISFSIAAVNSGVTTCGVSTDVTTTAATVPFGELSLSAFIDAAQTLTVSTNAVNGYSVTALANDQLGLNGGTCTGDPTTNPSCIQDARGDGNMTHDNEEEWNSTSQKGFAYSLDNDDAAAIQFEYTSTTGDCAGGGVFCARQFADAENPQTAEEIFSSTTVADAENVNVCYRVIPAVTNAAGEYQTYVTYNATATF